jgi:hypothetical protein
MERGTHDEQVARVRRKQVTTRSRSALLRVALPSAFALAMLLLAACGSSARTQPTATVVHATATATPLPPTSLTVLRYSPQDNRVPPFQQSTQDAAKVQQLYHMLDTLPDKAPSISCPLYAYGMGYELSFMDGNTLVLQVMLQTCYGVSISNAKGCRQWTPALTAQIAATLGVPASTLETQNVINTTGPGGPFAQPAPTPPILPRCFR